MDAERFNAVFEEAVEASRGVLVSKAGEYADDTDRLLNFKRASHLQGITNRQALGGMMAKHTVSVYDYIDKPDCPSLAKWDEKIIDHINYLLLLRAIVVEELEKEQETTD